MTKNITKDLSIQVKLNGLSFCIFDNQKNAISYLSGNDFEDKRSPNEVLIKLKEELSTNPVFSDDFKNIQIIHFNELSTFVPNELYNEANNADYLKFNAKILKTDFIASDVIDQQSVVNVYVPYVNINNYIFDVFGEFTYKHAATIFLEALTKVKNEGPALYVNVVKNAMQVIVLSDNKLKLYNFFEFFSVEDFIYYILFTMEQLQLNVESVPIFFSGAIKKNDDYYNIAYKYIRHVGFISGNAEVTIQHTTNSAHNNFIIKHSF